MRSWNDGNDRERRERSGIGGGGDTERAKRSATPVGCRRFRFPLCSSVPSPFPIVPDRFRLRSPSFVGQARSFPSLQASGLYAADHWSRRRFRLRENHRRPPDHGSARRRGRHRARARSVLSRPSGTAARRTRGAQLRPSELAGHRPARGARPRVTRRTHGGGAGLRLHAARAQSGNDDRSARHGDHRRRDPDFRGPAAARADGREGVRGHGRRHAIHPSASTRHRASAAARSNR